jgi:hypothetical protein
MRQSRLGPDDPSLLPTLRKLTYLYRKQPGELPHATLLRNCSAVTSSWCACGGTGREASTLKVLERYLSVAEKAMGPYSLEVCAKGRVGDVGTESGRTVRPICFFFLIRCTFCDCIVRLRGHATRWARSCMGSGPRTAKGLRAMRRTSVMRKWPSYSSGLCMYVVPCVEHAEHLALRATVISH